MSDESTVSTEETPQDRNAISVVTEENQAVPEASTPPPAAPPPKGEEDDEKSATSDESKPKRKTRRRSAERKIAALQRQLADAESAGAARDVEVAQLREQVAALTTAQEAPPAKKPRLQDFKTAEEYAEAHAAWKEGQAKPPAPPPPPAQPPAQPQTSTPPEPAPEVQELVAKGAEQFEDFEEVLSDNTLPISPAMADHIFDSEHGPELVMWIDENREEAQELFRMRPKKLAEALAEVEKGFDAPPPPAAQDEPKTPARGSDGKFASRQQPPEPPPPPGEPVGGNVNPGAGELREGLSMDDYAERRRRQMAANRTR